MIEEILEDPSITEIILQHDGDVVVEHQGKLHKPDDVWRSDQERSLLYSEIVNALPKAPNYEFPMASGVWKSFRVQVVYPPAINSGNLIQLRRISEKNAFTKFNGEDWLCSNEGSEVLKRKFVDEKENFLIVGATGCGKTTLLKSLISDFCMKDRVICIEDTPELPLVNSFSCNLQTYNSSSEEVKDITLNDLVKTSLRLRPDRLIMGEMRGEEAASFLLMLSTGHKGSGATLHAHNSLDALYRLEMLVQMGSVWTIETVRKLIRNSLNFIVIVDRNENGQRYIKEISELAGLEDDGFLVHSLYKNSNDHTLLTI